MTAQTVDPSHFRNALGSFATGVTIVTTTGLDGEDVGMTANSFNSVSLDPPMILWSIGKNTKSRPAFAEAEYFAVHILASEQRALSDRFAKKGIDKFEGLPIERGPGNVPLLKGCTARFQCRTAYRYEGGDHDIIVGEVIAFDNLDLAPLVFHGGRYSALSPRSQRDEAESAAFSRSFLGFLLPRVQYALFAPIKQAMDHLEIGLDEYLALSALAAKDLSINEIAELAQFYDRVFTAEQALSLAERSLIEPVSGDHASGTLRLTPGGRTLMLELLAIGKDAEESLFEGIDPADVHALKRLLNRLVQNTPSVAQL